ncbi:hypothetical protein MB9_2401 [Methanobacterium formicicum]|jgi:hypothetical protein|uniref:Uncharacterized protein n=1 Tax=Methanobacterium formicicum TaxID=2162 RepID=A0A0S4FSE4_METFO|nr:hypothetical protein MB9_2401 [Methanobacterium formicicum]
MLKTGNIINLHRYKFKMELEVRGDKPCLIKRIYQLITR